MPSCPPGFPATVFQGHQGLTADGAKCSGCKCDLPALMCPPDSLDEFFDNACMNPTASSPAKFGCSPTFAGSISSAQNSVQILGSTDCIPSQVVTMKPPASWQTGAVLCGNEPTGGGCNGLACVAKPAPPFAPGVCVYQSGNADCPDPFYKTKHLYYGGVNDTRGCDACGCDGPTGLACGVVDFYSANDCSGPSLFTLPSDGMCHASPGALAAAAFQFTPKVTGSCKPNGGAPHGSASPKDPTTVCCAD
jgi:hypothetical protein